MCTVISAALAIYNPPDNEVGNNFCVYYYIYKTKLYKI